MTTGDSNQERFRRLARRQSRQMVLYVIVLGLFSLSCRATKAVGEASSGTVVEAVGDPQSGGELSVGLAFETNGFNPYLGQWTASGYLVANAVFDPLSAFDPEGIARPYLAEEFNPTADFRSWQIRLRPNITFHNGEKLNSQALLKNLNAFRSSPLVGQAAANIADVRVVDDLTVVLDMKQPWATFPSALALQNGYVAAPAMLDAPDGGTTKPIGTGPFSFFSWQRDAALRVTRNPNYWRKDAAGRSLPYLDTVTFKILADGASRESAFVAGDVSAIESASSGVLDAVTNLSRAGSGHLISNAAKEEDELVLAFNTTKPPFNDLEARKAIALAVDQEEIAKIALGSWPAARGMFSEKSPFYVSPDEAGYPKHNKEEARQLAESYKQRTGSPLTFSFLVPVTADSLAIAQALQAQLAESGIDMKIETAEIATVIARIVLSGDYQAAFFLIWSSPTPDQGYMFLAGPPNPDGFSLNFTRFDDTELRAAMDEFRAEIDPDKRIETFKRVQKSLAKNLQLIFLASEIKGFLYANDAYGVVATTFPGSTTPAYNPYPATPFLTSTWRKQ